MDEMWDIKELSAYLGIKRSTLYARITEIPHYKINRLMRFRKAEIDVWLEGRRHDPIAMHTRARVLSNPSPRSNASSSNAFVARSIEAARREYNGPIGKPGHAQRKEGR